jgi:pyruvate ferredoxin oxidoreductase beta subunit/2-oxoisovalerate ferredoxin oxidoreductase beta subunit
MQQIQFSVPEEEVLAPGHLACAGCGAALAMRLVLKVLGRKTVLVVPACCWSVIDGLSPYSATGVPFIHTPLPSTAAAAAGIRNALDLKGDTETTVVAWAGDGGTFDIGIQGLSAAAERNEDIIFVCYDNEAYMNTGVQRSSATPFSAWTTTTPAVRLKQQPKKDLLAIMAAHGIPYAATATAAYPEDLIAKIGRAKDARGTRFIHLLSSCPPGWKISSEQAVEYSRLAVGARVFPLVEIEHGETWRVTLDPEPVPLETFLEGQGRFRHLMNDPEAVEQVRAGVEARWRSILARARA